MTKDQIFLKIGKKTKGWGYLYSIVRKADRAPLKDANGKAVPTILVGFEIDIPDSLFEPPNIFASFSIPDREKDVVLCVDVVDPSKLFEGAGS